MSSVPEKSDGDLLQASDWNELRTLYSYGTSDSAGGTISDSTTETAIGSATFSSGDVTSGLMVFANGYYRKSLSSNRGTTTIRLRAGTSTTATTNTEYISIDRESVGSISTAGWWKYEWSLQKAISDLDWDTTNYIFVTGENGDASSSISTVCENIEIIKI